MTDEADGAEVRARDLGVPFDGTPGRHNAITDVAGVNVGYTTLYSAAEGICTGVTAILPRKRADIGIPCAAGSFSLNGNGEMTGRAWIEESGQFNTPVLLTNSHSVGVCHTAADLWLHRNYPHLSEQWLLPVVAETWDGYLNDINGQHVDVAHAQNALDSATSGPIAEGSVGGGTGMNCYAFKGGSGTASRTFQTCGQSYTLGVFVQANFGSRDELRIAGVPVGRLSQAPNGLENSDWLAPARPIKGGAGSIIVVIATDAPLLPKQLDAIARRVPLGLARTGTTGSHFSGDIFLAFSTANRGALQSTLPQRATDKAIESLSFIPWGEVDPVYAATVEATEEAVLNALINNQDLTGRDGHFSPALPHDEVRSAVTSCSYTSGGQ